MKHNEVMILSYNPQLDGKIDGIQCWIGCQNHDKISNAVKSNESNTHNAKAPRTNNGIIYYKSKSIFTRFIEGVLEA